MSEAQKNATNRMLQEFDERMVVGGVIVNPDDLLQQAKGEPDPLPYAGIAAVLPTIHVLYDQKNMTFNDIQKWLAARGVCYSTPHINIQYRKWLEVQAGIKAGLAQLLDDDTSQENTCGQ